MARQNKGSRQEYKDLFRFYDDKNLGKVSVEYIPEMLRSCGLSPTSSEVDQILTKWQRETKSQGTFITLNEFVNLLETNEFSERNAKDDILKAFEILGSFKNATPGYLSKKDLSFALTKWGEGLSKAEIKELLNAIDEKNIRTNSLGEIDSLEFVEKVLML